MTILVATDKFKGTLTAAAAGSAMVAGARRVFPDANFDVQPLADGGEGTVEALLAGVGGRLVTTIITGPLGAPVEATYGRLDDGAIALEVASATGLALLSPDEYAPLDATSRGVGDLVTEVAERNTGARILIGIGGTASTDGGAGAATALGFRFLDAVGRELSPGGGALVSLSRIDSDNARRPSGVVGVSDVANPLLGSRGCARVYAPQKGASADEVAVLEEAMATLAERIRADLGLEVADLPGAGAGGGLGAGLVAFMGAELQPGTAVITRAVRLTEQIIGAELVITGEGSIDHQTLEGKVAAGVAEMARDEGVPCIAVAGRVALSDEAMRSAGFSAWGSAADVAGEERALAAPAEAVEEATHAALTAFHARWPGQQCR
jgi:glycerate kinase